MFCQRCNTMNADGIRFCGNCGAPLGAAQQQFTQSGQPQMQPGQPQMQPGQPQMQMQYQQPQMQPGYGQPTPQPAPPAGDPGNGGGKKGGSGLKVALIAVCALLVVAVVVLVLVLTGVIGGKRSSGSNAARSGSSTTRFGRNIGGSSSEEEEEEEPPVDAEELYFSEEGTELAIAAYTDFLEDYMSHPAKADQDGEWDDEEDLPEYVRFALVFIRDDMIPQLAVANGTSPWNPVHLFTYSPGEDDVIEVGNYSCYGEMYYGYRTGFFLDSWWGVGAEGIVYEMREEDAREEQSWSSDANGGYLVDGSKADEAEALEVFDKWSRFPFIPVFGMEPVALEDVRDIGAELERMAETEPSETSGYEDEGNNGFTERIGASPVEDELEGTWYDDQSDSVLELFYWGGSFVYTVGDTGNVFAGDITFPAGGEGAAGDGRGYVLTTEDGHELAELSFYYEGAGGPLVMEAYMTFAQDSYVTTFRKR